VDCVLRSHALIYYKFVFCLRSPAVFCITLWTGSFNYKIYWWLCFHSYSDPESGETGKSDVRWRNCDPPSTFFLSFISCPLSLLMFRRNSEEKDQGALDNVSVVWAKNTKRSKSTQQKLASITTNNALMRLVILPKLQPGASL
jgi:hypothetical protein